MKLANLSRFQKCAPDHAVPATPDARYPRGDTTVVIDDMITRLSGRTHQVLTSIAVAFQEQTWQTTQYSDVAFETLSDDMIFAYCSTQEPYDKAGGYGIQGLASIFIKEIADSHSGIMGLPLFETAQLPQNAGVRILP